MRYFLHIGYDGSNYRGWQYQADTPSVQETIEKKLHAIFKTEVAVVGCGRTDAGVHASQYMLHITIETPFDFDLKFRLNKHLPNDIVVHDLFEMERKQHARFDATSRTYDYFIHLRKDPFLSKYSSFYELEGLDFKTMKKAAALISLYTDFKAVCKQPDLHKTTICKVTYAQLYVDTSQQRLRFTITANRFLRGMVRLLVAYLLKIGTGEMTIVEFEQVLGTQLMTINKQPAFPNGLYLSKVEYPYLNVTAQSY
ncbi:MAG: tRNA pseudouridine(38-40) synthase TruA [Flavobacteriales bacterium]|nr:tRNA pseudouridine(38-40) synthase TruA [Flavobacteriales bacterium]